jgi:dihydroorotase
MKVKQWGMFEGSEAHITILDPARQWKFDVQQSKSKSRNSPFHGWDMKGKAVATVVHGKVVYEDRG